MVRPARAVTFQMAEVAVSARMFGLLLARIAVFVRRRCRHDQCAGIIEVRATRAVCRGDGKTKVEQNAGGSSLEGDTGVSSK